MNQVLERGVALPATPVEPYSCIMRHKHEQPEGEALAEAARSAFERVQHGGSTDSSLTVDA